MVAVAALAGPLVLGSVGVAGPTEPALVTVGTTPIALNQPADPLAGRISIAANADTKGMFGPQVGWPVIPVNVALTSSGHLVSYGSPLAAAQQGGVVFDDWNPAVGLGASAHTQSTSMHDYNGFCNGLVSIADGRLLMVGGNSVMTTMAYDPWTQIQTMGANLNRARWYATALRRPDDRIAVIGGGNFYAYQAYLTPTDNSVVATTPEIGTGTGAWTDLSGASSTALFGAENNRWWYPRAFNAPDGSVFGISGDRLWRMTTTGTGSIRQVGTLPTSMGVSGAAVMYAPGKILVAGGGEVANGTQVSGSAAATTIDLSGSAPIVRSTVPMAYKRNWDNATVLATGEVLVNGGTVVGTNAGAANSSYTAEIWSPTTGQWRTAATAQRIRTYHSTSLLLPSGAVFTGGGGIPGPEDNFNAEIYYPAYLFAKGSDGAVRWASRPKLTSISGNLAFGGAVKLGTGDARKIAAVNLITAASVTHSEGTDQRRVPLAFTQAANGSLTVTLPSASTGMAAGTYLLQAVDARGVPSPSQLVTLRVRGAGSVTIFEADRSSTGGAPAPVTSVTGTVPLAVGTSVSLQPEAFPGYLVRHQNVALGIDQIDAASPASTKADATFTVRAGLASSSGVSLEATNNPGYFLKAGAPDVTLAKSDGSAAFADNATFLPVHGLTGQNTSFALWSDPTRYLRHIAFALQSTPFDGSDIGRHDATFVVRPPVGTTLPVPGQRIALQSVNYPTYRVRHQNFVLKLSPIDAASPQQDLADSTFDVTAGLASGSAISLQATSWPGYYVVLDNGDAYLRKNDGTAAFAAAATFRPQQGLTGAGVSLAPYGATTAVYLRHKSLLLRADPFDGTDLNRSDATFTVLAVR